jgi:hypothetical protein
MVESSRNPAAARARIEAYIGASGSGKGLSIKRRLADLRPDRLLIWDPRDEYAGQAHAYRTLPDLVAAWRRAGQAGPCRARYVPGGALRLADAFALCCRLAFEAGELVFVAEELSDVTTASHAPAAWRQCITQGRHKGLVLIGATQRPALIDKTYLANCTLLRCGYLGYEADRRAMAVELDVPRDLVAGLDSVDLAGGGVRLAMLERDRPARTLERVTLTVSAAGIAREQRQRA